MRLTHDPGMAFINAAKYRTSRLSARTRYPQCHVAFAFLLDYVPDWRLAYGRGGFIQYQLFVPTGAARECLRDVLRICQSHAHPAVPGGLQAPPRRSLPPLACARRMVAGARLPRH